jgi:site-specific recombinase XerD
VGGDRQNDWPHYPVLRAPDYPVAGSLEDRQRKGRITRRLRLYDLRHFFVTSAIEAGADYKTLSDIVGSSPETLRRHYQHVSSAARVKLIGNMPSLPVFPS